MHAIRCGVALDDNTATTPFVWNVMRAVSNQAESDAKFLSAFEANKTLHIFSSSTAIAFFSKRIAELKNALERLPDSKILFTCGVGQSTDAAAQALTSQFHEGSWQFVPLAKNTVRENGLQWTLQQLCAEGLIPETEVHLWTKTHSASEKILEAFRSSQNCPDWKTTVHEIYELGINRSPWPQRLTRLLQGGQPICFGARSAEVLDALLVLLCEHFQLRDHSQLPEPLRFSVWEKSATQRAEELHLQDRLIPFSKFESLASLGSPAE